MYTVQWSTIRRDTAGPGPSDHCAVAHPIQLGPCQQTKKTSPTRRHTSTPLDSLAGPKAQGPNGPMCGSADKVP